MRTTNLLILRGYTGGAPKPFGNGRIAKVSVATNRSWIDKTTGDRVEKTELIGDAFMTTGGVFLWAKNEG